MWVDRWIHIKMYDKLILPVRMYVCTYACVYVYDKMGAWKCMYVCMYVCMYSTNEAFCSRQSGCGLNWYVRSKDGSWGIAGISTMDHAIEHGDIRLLIWLTCVCGKTVSLPCPPSLLLCMYIYRNTIGIALGLELRSYIMYAWLMVKGH